MNGQHCLESNVKIRTNGESIGEALSQICRFAWIASTFSLQNLADIKVKRTQHAEFSSLRLMPFDCVSLELSRDLWAPYYPSDVAVGYHRIVVGRSL